MKTPLTIMNDCRVELTSGIPLSDRKFGRSKPGRRHIEAYLMVECLVYIAVLAIVLGVAFGAFYRCLGNSRDLTRNADDIVRALKAGEVWRADVRSAVGPLRPVETEEFNALEIPSSTGTIAYVYHNNALWRKGAKGEAKQILSGVKASRMLKDARTRIVCWRWELELATRKKVVRILPLFSFQAVPIIREP